MTGPGGRPGHGPRAGRPRRTAPSVDRPRRVAYRAIRAVTAADAYANLVLPGMLADEGLTGRDAAFATELTYGTLRMLGTLDRVIDRVANREIDPPVRDVLRLGAYQLLHTRVPAHAAVSTSVALLRAEVGGAGAAGFVNAVLRRVGDRDLDGWVAEITPESADPTSALAVRHAHPEWIVRAFADALGGDLDETAAALAADNERPPVHLAARPGRIDRDALAAAVGGVPGRWSPYAVYLKGGAPADLPWIADGRAHVQDEGSQLVTLALAAADLDGEDARWLDLCAGPGGKAGMLGALAALRGARVTAVEVAPHRARLVEQAVAGLPVVVHCADGRSVGEHPDLPERGFDRVLVDAPCTGLGALRRRPEARWRRKPADLPPLTRLQRELLAAALRAVRPGGVVGYVTCSPHIAETLVTATETARRSPVQVELVDARPLIPGDMPALGSGPTVQLWPHRHGTDAMFLALLRRTG